jgi:L-histidine N-alpha-methyltransferase
LSFRLERRLGPGELREDLAREAREGLTASPRWMRSRWVWDARGSELFARITELPAYTRPETERRLLAARAGGLAAHSDAETYLELGPGSAARTELVLDTLPSLRRVVLLDVSEAALADAGRRLAEDRPELEVVGVVGDFERSLDAVETCGRTLVACLGSTIGALEEGDRASLLTRVGACGADLLLGLDLVKPAARTLAAYGDREGLSASLIANLLPVLNRELGAGFDPSRFRSETLWVAGLERLEMRVVALVDQTVHVEALGLDVHFAEGETLRTEVSRKFRREGVEAELSAAGLSPVAWWADERDGYAVCLATASSSAGA